MTVPSPIGVCSVNDQSPAASTVVVPRSAHELFKTESVAPGSPVPAIVGVVSWVALPGAGLAIAGAPEAVESIVIESVVGNEALPAASLAITLMECDPSAKGNVGVNA